MKNTIKRSLSMTTFSVLIAAVTISFADAPKSRTALTFSKRTPSFPSPPRAATPFNKSTATSAEEMKPEANRDNTSTNAESTEVLNLNTATAAELTRLPGIGPKKAEKIVKWRTARGRFARVLDLRRVKGFGAKSVKKLRPYLTVSKPSASK